MQLSLPCPPPKVIAITAAAERRRSCSIWPRARRGRALRCCSRPPPTSPGLRPQALRFARPPRRRNSPPPHGPARSCSPDTRREAGK